MYKIFKAQKLISIWVIFVLLISVNKDAQVIQVTQTTQMTYKIALD